MATSGSGLSFTTSGICFKAVGCEECRHTGYKGRIGIYEFMPLSLTTKQLIGVDANLNQLRQQAKRRGRTFTDCRCSQDSGRGHHA